MIEEKGEQCESIEHQRYAVIGKKSKKDIIYYQPVDQKLKKQMLIKQLKFFHPNNWTINNFYVGRHLGRGKYGHVYLVKEKKTKLIMALKKLSKPKILQEQVLGQVRRQIQIHSHLNHQNILSMYGFFFDEKDLYIMMEFSTKGDLFGVLRKNKRFQEKKVKMYMKQMVNAVYYLQKMKILHRDIKPQNIMVSSDDILKLSDFGWSIKSNSKSRSTFCGTPDYFCPQIVKCRPFDYKVDNWSLGILAYELLCGNPPFFDQQRKKLFQNIMAKQIIYPSFVSLQFRDFVNKLTRKAATDRMQLSQALNHPWLKDQMEIQNSRQSIQRNYF